MQRITMEIGANQAQENIEFPIDSTKFTTGHANQ